MTSHTADLPTRYRYREEGRELERERIAAFIRVYAENWQRTPTFNFRIELHKLAEVIEKGNNG